jgi:hypothetical protein
MISRKNKNKINIKLLQFITPILGLLVIFVTFDLQASQEYIISNNYSTFNPSYKSQFNKLIINISEGKPTGILSYDEKDLMFDDIIDITPGYGDFKDLVESTGTPVSGGRYVNVMKSNGNIPLSKTDVKTSTYTNWFTWDISRRPFINSTIFNKNSVLYNKSGVVKLFDRYVLTAIGEYWSIKYGLDNPLGNTYRITLDNGQSYDIIVMDIKSGNDNHAIKYTVNNKNYAIGHLVGTTINNITYFDNICLTEFYRIDMEHKTYPVNNINIPNNYPSINYSTYFNEIKDDINHVNIKNNAVNSIKEFNGNIISFQLIKDPKVEDILKEAKEEIDKYE